MIRKSPQFMVAGAFAQVFFASLPALAAQPSVTAPAAAVATSGQRNLIIEQAKFDITGYRVEGNTLLSDATLQAVLTKFTGPQKTFDDVAQATAALRTAYADAGYPIATVTAPEQILNGGQVVLKALEGRLMYVTVAGNKAYDVPNLRASVPPLKEGGPVNTKDLVAAITLANENPAKQISVNFTPGLSVGEVDARIDVVEEDLAKTTLTADNQGSPATGRTRIGIGYQYANLFNRDHQFGLQYTTTAERPQDVKNLVGNYRIPFYAQGLTLDLIGSYSDSQSTTAAPIGDLFFTGKGTYVAARLNQALPGVGELRHKVSYGIDYKDFANNCGVAGIALPACGSVSALPISASYVFQYATAAVLSGGSVSVVTNLPGGAHGSEAEYDAARKGAAQRWSAVRAAAFAGIPLSGDWQARAQIATQVSSSLLVPAEQYGIGGANSIRGYEERVAAGDQGYNASLEVYTPDFGKLLGGADTKLRALVFYDFGSVSKNQPLITEDTIRLSSVGLGLRLGIGKDLSAKLDVGWIRNDAGTRTANQASGSASVAYSF